jgi:peptide/nickel transport system ATP-binding protein
MLSYNPALLHQHAQQQQQQQQQFPPDLWGAAAGAAAATHASTQPPPLQHAGSSGPSASGSSGGAAARKSKGGRAPTTAAATTTTTKKPAAAGQRKPRKVTEAQRAAHKRFRIRRKEQVGGVHVACCVPFVSDWSAACCCRCILNNTARWGVAFCAAHTSSSAASTPPGSHTHNASTHCCRTVTRTPHVPATITTCHALHRAQVSSLAAEVAAKQEQLAALEAEHEALTAKARALDQLVASAGARMCVEGQGRVLF